MSEELKKSDLQILLNFQAKLQVMHGHDFPSMTIEEKEQYTRDMILYLLEETHELLRETNFKTYKKTRKPVIKEKIEEELVDIFCFYLNLCLCWNVDSKSLLKAYFKKNKINVDRVNNTDY